MSQAPDPTAPPRRGFGHFELMRRRDLLGQLAGALLFGIGSWPWLAHHLAAGIIVNSRSRFFIPRVVAWDDRPILFAVECGLVGLLGCAGIAYLLFFFRAVSRRLGGRPGGLSLRRKYRRPSPAGYPRLFRKK